MVKRVVALVSAAVGFEPLYIKIEKEDDNN